MSSCVYSVCMRVCVCNDNILRLLTQTVLFSLFETYSSRIRYITLLLYYISCIYEHRYYGPAGDNNNNDEKKRK